MRIVILEKLHKFTKNLPEKYHKSVQKHDPVYKRGLKYTHKNKRQRSTNYILIGAAINMWHKCQRSQRLSALPCFLNPVSSFVIVLLLVCASPALLCKHAVSQTATVKPESEASGQSRNYSHKRSSASSCPLGKLEKFLVNTLHYMVGAGGSLSGVPVKGRERNVSL